jgi:hypothetical protein
MKVQPGGLSGVGIECKILRSDPKAAPSGRGECEGVVLNSITHAEFSENAISQTYASQDFKCNAVFVVLRINLAAVSQKRVWMILERTSPHISGQKV